MTNIGHRAGGPQPQESRLETRALFFHRRCLVSLALYVDGHANADGVVLVLALVVEMIASAITGEKGNNTER